MTNMFKTLASAAVSGLLMSSAAAQRRRPPSSAKCRITGTGFANSKSSEVGVSVAAQASAYICDPDAGSATANGLATSTAIAEATATAIASVFAECTAEGNGAFMVNGRSLAQAEAFAIASSYAEALVEANACGFCSVVAEFVADSFESIFISAAADAEVALQGAANGGSVQSSADVLAEEIITASATAYAQVIIAAAADFEAGCSGSIVGAVGVGTCTVEVDASDETLVEDAETELIVDLIAEACENDENVTLTVDATATATATAMARAIAKVTAECDIQGGTTACVLGQADISTAAEAVASAYADAVVEGRSTCDPPLCSVDAIVIAEVVVPILAEATASAVFAQCASSGDTFSTTVLEDEIETATAKVLSSVYALVSVVGGECDLSAEAIAEIMLTRP